MRQRVSSEHLGASGIERRRFSRVASLRPYFAAAPALSHSFTGAAQLTHCDCRVAQSRTGVARYCCCCCAPQQIRAPPMMRAPPMTSRGWLFKRARRSSDCVCPHTDRVMTTRTVLKKGWRKSKVDFIWLYVAS